MVEFEFKGQNARVRVDGDELLFSHGGRAARALVGSTEWRIPIACIREVVFKDAKFAAGLLHLVIADAESPAASVWGLADRPWTVQFQAGKQAKAMRELRDFLSRRIVENRAAGIDPIKARRPYVDQSPLEAVRGKKESALGDTLVLASEGALPSDVVALARENPNYSEFWTDLDTLAERLGAGEQLTAMALGRVSTSPVIVAVTDSRVLLHRDSPLQQFRDSMDRPVQVSWDSGLMSGALVLRSGSRELKIGALSDDAARALIRALG